MNRTGVSFETRELADWLVAFEEAAARSLHDDAHATCRVCEKLRRPLSVLAGTAGFRSLFARALTLAKREVPALSVVQVNADGSLEGFSGDITKANGVLIAQLLGLLTTFIGAALMMRLLHAIWPDLPGSAFSSLREEIR